MIMNIRKIRFFMLILMSMMSLLSLRDLQSAGLDLFDDKTTEKSEIGQSALESAVDKSLEKNRLEKLYDENAEMIKKCHCVFSICLTATKIISYNDPNYLLKIEKQEAEKAATKEHRENLESVCRKWKKKFEEAEHSDSSVSAASFLDDFYEKDKQIKSNLQSKIKEIEVLHDQRKEQAMANYRQRQEKQAALEAQRAKSYAEAEERQQKQQEAWLRDCGPKCNSISQ